MTTWTPASQQSETWTTFVQQPQRTFSPYTFSRRPVFDTGPTAGTWDVEITLAGTWTVKP